MNKIKKFSENKTGFLGVRKKVLRYGELFRLLNGSYYGLNELRKINNIPEFLKKYEASFLGFKESSALDIGCGVIPANFFKSKNVYGIDIRDTENENIKKVDLVIENIPFQDNTFHYITAFDFLEHVPRIIYVPDRRFAFIELMNEIWRTLKPGGIFISKTPVFPYSEAFRDPTHVNILSHETFPLYFDNKHCWAKMYGFYGSFEVLEQVIINPDLISVLKKCKKSYK